MNQSTRLAGLIGPTLMVLTASEALDIMEGGIKRFSTYLNRSQDDLAPNRNRLLLPLSEFVHGKNLTYCLQLPIYMM